MIYSPVTILSENEIGQIGVEDYDSIDQEALRNRLKELEHEGWEPITVMIDEEQRDMTSEEWKELKGENDV